MLVTSHKLSLKVLQDSFFLTKRDIEGGNVELQIITKVLPKAGKTL